MIRNIEPLKKTLPNEFEDPSVFCASQEGFDFGTCTGDSGGPIIVKKIGKETYTLVGKPVQNL